MFSFGDKTNWKTGIRYIHCWRISKLEKVKNEKDCALLNHMGKDPNSAHNFAV